MAAIEAAGSATARSFAGSDDIATLNYTGGTTGKSKGALRTHREYGGFANAILADFEIPEAARYLTVAPISHVAGTKVLPTLMRGGTVHMLKSFDPEAVLKTIERERINFTLFVPTMIYVLLDHPALDKTDLSSLELLLYGASAMSPSRLVEGIERIGPVFSQLYGQTECYPVSVLRKADHDPKTPELFLSCGFPIAACDVKILDDNDREVKTGEPGEICVRAPHVMTEYWKRPEQTAETLKNGWLHTGDIARADERGYMFILDRKKDMIVSGGFNIFPREVEDVLVAARRRGDGRRRRCARRQMGRGRHRRDRGARGRSPERGRTDQPCEGAQGFGACAEAHQIRHRAADDRRRQGRQEGLEGRLLGRARADGGVDPTRGSCPGRGAACNAAPQ